MEIDDFEKMLNMIDEWNEKKLKEKRNKNKKILKIILSIIGFGLLWSVVMAFPMIAMYQSGVRGIDTVTLICCILWCVIVFIVPLTAMSVFSVFSDDDKGDNDENN